MARTNPLGVRILPEIKTALDQAASDYGRSISTMVEGVLADWLIAKGYMSSPESLFAAQFQDEYQDHSID
jgi:hypothetical protein